MKRCTFRHVSAASRSIDKASAETGDLATRTAAPMRSLGSYISWSQGIPKEMLDECLRQERSKLGAEFSTTLGP